MQDIESALLKQDAQKDAKRAATDAPAAVAQALALNDASAARRRGKMMLPAPQAGPDTCAGQDSIMCMALTSSVSPRAQPAYYAESQPGKAAR